MPTTHLPPTDDDGRYPAYAWPGGYAVAYVADDGELLCATCVNDPDQPTHLGGDADGWRLDGYMTADWHDQGEGDWTCAHCGVVIDADPDDVADLYPCEHGHLDCATDHDGGLCSNDPRHPAMHADD